MRVHPKMKVVITMITRPIKLIETIDETELVLGNEFGIFNAIYNYDSGLGTPQFTWLTEDLSKQLDLDYYLQHSGDKIISKFFQRLWKQMEDGNISDLNSLLMYLAVIIEDKFTDKWNKIHSAFIESTYKPLDNYNMEEKTTPDLTRTKNVKMKTETANDIYGFNSTASVPQSKTTNSGEKLDNEETEKNTGTNTVNRSGNIGVTTSQQMLQSEIDLRESFMFEDMIMNDVDSILCLLVY